MVELMMRWGEPVGMFVAFVLTIMVLSYLIGDNVLFRVASHLFIGLTAGYVTVLIVYGILWQQLILPLFNALFSSEGSLNIAVMFGLLFGLILLFARSAAWGRPVVAYLVGVGAATAIGGALFGTIVPQVNASANLFADGVSANWLVMGLVVFVGTVTTLIYFNFRARAVGDLPTKRQLWIEALGAAGQFFVAVTFGVLFAAMFTAALAALVQRLYFMWTFLWDFVLPSLPLT
jgi:hypothetical protein